MTNLRVREISEQQALTLGGAWDRLLDRSDADPLFGSREWLTEWWQHHAADFGLQMFGLVTYAGKDLVGLALFHHRHVPHRGGLSGERIELVGNLWRTRGTAQSERTGFIVDRSYPAAHDLIADHLVRRDKWSDLVLSHVGVGGATCRAVTSAASSRKYYRRLTDETTAYDLDLSEGFATVMSRLSPKTRRKVLAERKKLGQLGDVAWETAGAADLEDFFASLDQVHEARWGWKASKGRRGEMYRQFARRKVSSGELVLSRLRVGQSVIAASLDFRSRGRQYGIQQAVDTSFARGLSPGFLHTGFNLERACAEGVRQFDFLSGEGKNSDYKHALAAQESSLACLQVVRSPVLARMHRFGDRIGRDRLHRLFSRQSQ